MSHYPHRETPIRRTNPSGRTRWVARYTGRDGRRRSAGTFRLEREAQDAIDLAYERAYGTARATVADTVGAYLEPWTRRHPRSQRTNATNEHRVERVLDVELEGRRLADWPLAELRRRHALDLVDHMLRVQRRAPLGAVNILRALSSLVEDAITDELVDVNAFKGVRVRGNDPRAEKRAVPPRVVTFDEMHAFAAAAARVRTGKHKPSQLDRWRSAYAEPLVRAFSDAGLRLGEALGLRTGDVDSGVIHSRGSAHNGVYTPGDAPTKRHVRDVPCSSELARLLAACPPRIGTDVLFPTPTGRIWWERNFYRDVWQPAQRATGLDVRPHDMRHSWVTHLRAAGVDDADLAQMAGHSIDTMLARYTHSLGRSHDRVRRIVGLPGRAAQLAMETDA